MTYIFRLPDIGEGIAEAEITAWHVRVGDHLAEDQPMADLMTDKATVEMTAPVAGRVTALHGEVGAMVRVGAPLIELAQDGEAAPAARTPAAPVLAAPATRALAREHGVALETVPGTGPEGRITDADLRAALARPAGVTERKLTGLRRRIAEAMEISARRIPHFSYVEEFDLTELENLRQELNAGGDVKLTLLPFFMRAVVRTVPDFPQVNARYDDEAGILQLHEAVHIGIATQTEAGLMVPVVRDAQNLDLFGCARELARVAAAARDGSAAREALRNSTITLTSLGALGGIAATPIINHPEVAIIGPNKLLERPVVRHGRVEIRRMMNVSASFDHRVVDGFDAARFMQALRRLLESPARLFMAK